ncbi:BON1-associated protein 2-like [Macadamia integrifolia]|uniref:BON1-associated protein 2-like n=1 Tax=Macadamia integrifolia TaxID=60698 RepID=UPI001C4F5F00|nr:BON1-associated protein 2-like [Macadamia integrifolia]
MEKASTASTSSSRSLEITIISAEDLRLNGRAVKKNAFVTVRTDSHNQEVVTRMDSEGGSYPSWNQKLEPLPLPNSAYFITVEVQCKTSTGVRTVGTARISVSEFIGDYMPPQFLHFLSYRLRDRKGKRNGIINFSMKTVGPGRECFGLVPSLGVLASGAAHENHKNLASGSGSGTAIGVPVPYAHGYGLGYGM